MEEIKTEKTIEELIDEKLTSVVEKLNKKEEKPVFTPEQEKAEKVEKMNKALRDVSSGRINRITIDKAVNAEGTDNIGGYLVPLEYGNELIGTINQYGFTRQNATIKKMTRDKMNFATVSTDIVAYNPSEGAQITASNYIFGQVQLDTTKYATLVPVTNDLLADSAYDLQSEVLKSSAIGFANKEDTLCINALSGATLAVSAVAGAAFSTSMTGQYGYGKLIDTIATLEGSNTNYIRNAKWLMSPTTKATLRKIVDTTGQPVLQSAQGGQPETLLGYPIITSNLMPASSVTGGSGQSRVMFFGNFENVYFGDRQSMDIYVGREGTVGSDNMLEKDMSAFRCTERVDVKVARPDAFVKLVVSSS